MVEGLEKFKEAFANYADSYVIIGGTACDITLTNSLMKPRATKDIDIILVTDKMTLEFVQAFWKFIREGGYSNGQRKKGDENEKVSELYRFQKPIQGYPQMLELFSKHEDALGDSNGFYLEPIVLNQEPVSLSAIMMDDDYYNITTEYSRLVEGIRIASPEALICLKVKAYLNLLSDKEKGKKVDTKDIRKHRNDVLKLVASSSFDVPFKISLSVMKDIHLFTEKMKDLLYSTPQNLIDALDRPKEDIEVYIDALKDLFVIE